MTIGAVLIVKNEEKVLDRCLSSLKGFDEIVVLDTGSSDTTCEIARKYTDKVIEGAYKWNDSFCEARNKALGYSTADVVLSIDADEYLEENGLLKIKAVLEARKDMNVFDVTLKDESNGATHYFPRLFKRIPEIFWEGDIHNHLNFLGQTQTNITITYGVSPAHANDPNRAFRILTNYVSKNPRCVREKFYLAREYMYRRMWEEAIHWYESYLLVGNFSQEVAEAHYQLGLCFRNTGDYEKARKHCLASIYVNTNYSSPIELLAYLSGPKNKDRWLVFAEGASEEDALFKPGNREKGAEWYDRIFATDDAMARYDKIHNRIVELVGGRVALDAGCGNGRLLARLPSGSFGFDISPEGVKQCQALGLKAEIGNVYDYDFSKGGYEVLVTAEVVEHVDDKRYLSRIPSGTQCIITVPSFLDPSHVHIYTKRYFMHRLGHLFTDVKFEFFYWDNATKSWTSDHVYTNDYIILITATRR